MMAMLDSDKENGDSGAAAMENDKTHDGRDKNRKKKYPEEILFIGTDKTAQLSAPGDDHNGRVPQILVTKADKRT